MTVMYDTGTVPAADPVVAPLQRQAYLPGLAGFVLQNAIVNPIISWSVPNDDQLHRVQIFASMTVQVAETGGLIQVKGVNPDGAPWTHTLFPAGLDTGEQSPALSISRIIEPGSTVSVLQASALTAGQASMWPEIWGS